MDPRHPPIRLPLRLRSRQAPLPSARVARSGQAVQAPSTTPSTEFTLSLCQRCVAERAQAFGFFRATTNSGQALCGDKDCRVEDCILHFFGGLSASLRLRSGQACRRRLNKSKINCGAKYEGINPQDKTRVNKKTPKKRILGVRREVS